MSLDLPRVDDVGVGLSMVTPISLDASPLLVGVVADALADSLDDDPDADAVVCSFTGVFTVTSLPRSEVVEPFTDKGFKIYAESIMISANQEAVCFF